MRFESGRYRPSTEIPFQREGAAGEGFGLFGGASFHVLARLYVYHGLEAYDRFLGIAPPWR